ALLAAAAVLWLAYFLGLAAAGLSAGGSACIALGAVAPGPVFAGAGMLVSQLAPTRRLATAVCAGALLLALVLRVVADTSPSLSWLRWATPLGWAEELRPLAGSRPLVLLLLL